MRMSVDRMPEEVDNSLADVNTYLNTTELQINALFIDNYQLLSTTLNHILDGELSHNQLSKSANLSLIRQKCCFRKKLEFLSFDGVIANSC